MLPGSATFALRFGVEKLDTGIRESRSGRREGLDREPDDRTRAEETVMRVTRAVDMSFGPVAQTKPARVRIFMDQLQAEHVAIKTGHRRSVCRANTQPPE